VHMWCTLVSAVFCCSCVVTMSLHLRMLLCSLTDLYCALCSAKLISYICIMMRCKCVTCGAHLQGARNPKNPLYLKVTATVLYTCVLCGLWMFVLVLLEGSIKEDVYLMRTLTKTDFMLRLVME